MELNKIYCMDCLQGMKELIPDKSIDAVISDLPFGVTANKWDKVIPFDELWNQYARIIKDNGIIILNAVFGFASKLVETSKVQFRYDLIWKKNKSTGHLNANKMPLRQHELILVFYNKLPVYNPQKSAGHEPVHSFYNRRSGENYHQSNRITAGGGSTERYPTSIIEIDVIDNKSNERIHSCQKPVELLEYLIKQYTSPGAIILDNAIGSGTTAAATLKVGEGRSFIGFEIDENCCGLANERLKIS